MAIALTVTPAGAALTSYASLITEIPLYLKRTDLAERVPLFLRLAEAEINRRLALKPVRPMLTRTALTIAAEYVGAPTDLMKPASIQLSDESELDYVDPTNISRLKAERAPSADDLFVSTPTTLHWYTLVDGEFRFYPAPTTSYSSTLTYWARLPALTESNTSNWLLDDHPDVYWYGILAHASRHIRDEAEIANNTGLFDDALQKVLDAYPARTNMTPLRSDVPPMRRTLS